MQMCCQAVNKVMLRRILCWKRFKKYVYQELRTKNKPTYGIRLRHVLLHRNIIENTYKYVSWRSRVCAYN